MFSIVNLLPEKEKASPISERLETHYANAWRYQIVSSLLKSLILPEFYQRNLKELER